MYRFTTRQRCSVLWHPDTVATEHADYVLESSVATSDFRPPNACSTASRHRLSLEPKYYRISGCLTEARLVDRLHAVEHRFEGRVLTAFVEQTNGAVSEGLAQLRYQRGLLRQCSRHDDEEPRRTEPVRLKRHRFGGRNAPDDFVHSGERVRPGRHLHFLHCGSQAGVASGGSATSKAYSVNDTMQ